MVIKNLAWKIYWNVSNFSNKGVLEDLEHQDSLRKLRKNSNRLLHDIISFSPDDSKNLTEEKVRNLAFEYLNLKAHKQIAYGQIHRDKDHWHVHFMLSPNQLDTPKSVHIDRKKYFSIRKELELYQQRQYPELSKSIVFLHSKEKEKKRKVKDHIVQIEKRTGKTSQVSQIQNTVKQCFDLALSKEDFIDRLLQQGYEIYYYRNKINGIKVDGKKYRFSRLGIDREHIRSLDSIEKQLIKNRLNELSQLQDQPSKSRSLWR